MTIEINSRVHGKLQLIVDECMYPVLKHMRWFAKGRKKFYAFTCIGGKHYSIESFLIKKPIGMIIDHIDRNGLNNQMSNLRVVTRCQNQWNKGMHQHNTSGFKGVSKSKSNTYRAVIRVFNRIIGLGHYQTPEEAAIAYNNAAIKYHGEYAYQNKIQER